MRVEQRSTYDDAGAYVRTITFKDVDDITHDRVVVRVPPDADVMRVEGYQDDTVAYEQSFELRDLSFDPISAIGRGETTRLTGTSTTNNDETVPRDVETALNSLGMAVVPNGEWWL